MNIWLEVLKIVANPIRKKLIEVSIPLEAINVASAREKSIRHGHPSTLHLWWARRPLAACRAVLFAQLVDDPSAWPERFPDGGGAGRGAQAAAQGHRADGAVGGLERRGDPERGAVGDCALGRLGPWRGAAGTGRWARRFWTTSRPRRRRSTTRSRAAGRSRWRRSGLGLRAYGSDLNPVAVLIGKALVEIPPKFAGLPPVNPKARAELIERRQLRTAGRARRGWPRMCAITASGCATRPRGASAISIRRRSCRMAREATVIAWLWARTVLPRPGMQGRDGAVIGKLHAFNKSERKNLVGVSFDRSGSNPRPIFNIRTGNPTKQELGMLSIGSGYMAASGKKAKAVFRCLCCGEGPVKGEYVDNEANAGRMSAVPMAIVADGPRGRLYFPVDPSHVVATEQAATFVKTRVDIGKLPTQECRGTYASNAQGRIYGFKTFADYFTARQLVALTTFADLISEAREIIGKDALEAGFEPDETPLHAGGMGADSVRRRNRHLSCILVEQTCRSWLFPLHVVH